MFRGKMIKTLLTRHPTRSLVRNVSKWRRQPPIQLTQRLQKTMVVVPASIVFINAQYLSSG